MDWNVITDSPGLSWLILAGALALIELVLPGIFLVFVAAGAMVTGLVALLFPGLTALVQALIFIVTTSVAVSLGRKWYARHEQPGPDPMLNDRAARLIGQIVIVSESIAHGRGRVRVGDGEWLASGPDVAAGAEVRITGSSGAILIIEPTGS